MLLPIVNYQPPFVLILGILSNWPGLNLVFDTLILSHIFLFYCHCTLFLATCLVSNIPHAVNSGLGSPWPCSALHLPDSYLLSKLTRLLPGSQKPTHTVNICLT